MDRAVKIAVLGNFIVEESERRRRREEEKRRDKKKKKKRRQAMACEEPCKADACRIQNCLRANGYDESRCSALIDALYACCERFYAANKANGTDERTVCCPRPALLALKMQQRRESKGELDARRVN